jgi:uncharacterized membrane protein
MLRCITRFDHGLLWLNTLLLLFVAFVPHPTAIVAEYLQQEAHQSTAMMIYSGTWFIIAVMINLLWWYARSRDLLTATLDVTTHV